MKTQATKATRNEVLLHIERQRVMGELMIGEHDRPRLVELVTVAGLVGVVFYANYMGWL